ncbi:hypothetical protein AGMMS50267_03690 [Spirochaetia bacterium]|nr:hypothetical protein AGMMS50267_03690 [Spirochaetia bacterium]
MKFPEGKSVAVIARENDITPMLVRNWAQKNDVPRIEGEGLKTQYIFDAESEKRFKSRKTVPGRPAVPKTPKPKGKPGRPRAERTEPKKSAGQGRNEKRASVEGKKPLGRPRKGK